MPQNHTSQHYSVINYTNITAIIRLKKNIDRHFIDTYAILLGI